VICLKASLLPQLRRFGGVVCLLLLLSSPLSAQPRSHIGILPTQTLYSSAESDWFAVLLQEELTWQLQLNGQFAVKSAETLRLQNPKTQSEIASLMRQARISHLVQLSTQQVLQKLSVSWTLYYVEDNRLQTQTSQSQHSLKSTDTNLRSLLNVLRELHPVFQDVVYFPQNVKWEALAEFYRWKSRVPTPWNTETRSAHLQALLNLNEQFEGLQNRVRVQQAILLIQQAFEQTPPAPKRLEEALELLEPLRRDFPNHPEYRALAALLYYAQNNRFEAKAEAVIANARHPYHGPSWLLYALSIDNDPQQNAQLIRRALRYYTLVQHSPHPHLAYTVLRPELSIWLQKPAEMSNPLRPDNDTNQHYADLLMKGAEEFRRGEWEEATRTFQEAEFLKPEELTPALYLARIALGQAQYDVAKDQLVALRERFAEDDEVTLYLGYVYEMQRTYNVAESLYRQSLQQNPENARSALRLGTVLIKKGDLAEAQSFLESVTEKYPTYAVAWWNLGLLYRETEQIASARQAFESALMLDPNNVKIQSALRSLPKVSP
jgi:superkiller protein 3